MKKEIRAWIFLVALQLVWIIPIGYAEAHKEPIEEEMITEWEDVIRWRIDDADVSIEELEVDVVQRAEMRSLGTFKLTAYCPCKSCSADYGTQTSTGAVATEGRTVAVDPNVIPYGTVLIINIDGEWHEYVAEDCGVLVKGNVIDIFFNEHKSDFREYAEVFVKEMN